VLLARADIPVGERGVLGDQVDDVHPKAVGAALEPPPHHRVDRFADLNVLPVQVRLLAGEQVQVVLARALVVLPRRTGEERPPVVGLGTLLARHGAVAGGSPPVPVPFRVVLRRPRLHEPGVLVGGVVDDQVHHQLEATTVYVGQQPVELLQRPEQRVDVLVVADVVAVVVHRRAIHRRQPENVDPQRDQMVEASADAGQVTRAVAVPVGEAAGVDLVDDGATPPLVAGHRP
jgi:hypothetical protein